MHGKQTNKQNFQTTKKPVLKTSVYISPPQIIVFLNTLFFLKTQLSKIWVNSFVSLLNVNPPYSLWGTERKDWYFCNTEHKPSTYQEPIVDT